MKKLASEIYAAVKSGTLKEPFSPSDFRRACPGWADATYGVFLSKHRVGNPGRTTELFEQIAPGKFRTLARLRD